MRSKKARITMLLILMAVLAVTWLAFDPADIQPVKPFEISTTEPGEDGFVTKQFWPSNHDRHGDTATGVAVGPDGSIFVLHRAGRPFAGDGALIPEPVIVKLEAATGKVLGKFGSGLFGSPHGLAVGDDGTMWVADTALNAVLRLDQDGELLQRYGDRYSFWLEPLLRIRNLLPRLPLPMTETTFARPTDVALLSGGRFAVTDGYRNSRVAVFKVDGTLVWQVNWRGSEPGAFHLPHGLTSDDEDRLYVADRRNARIQVLSGDGRLERVINSGIAGRPFALEVGPDGCLYVADGGDSLDLGASTEAVEFIDRVGVAVLDLSGKPFFRGGEVGNQSGRFQVPHDIAVASPGRAYVADIGSGQVQSVEIGVGCKT